MQWSLLSTVKYAGTWAVMLASTENVLNGVQTNKSIVCSAFSTCLLLMVFGGFPFKCFQIPILMGGPDLEFIVK